jgi:membrane-associated protease RseP (regulator of RpoE activity)
MRRFESFPKPFLATLASLFAGATILYSALWIFYQRWQVPVQLGFDNEYVEADHSELLTKIYKDSPAEKAGLRVGDRILRVDREPFESSYSLTDIWARHKPGDSVELTIQRPGVSTPLVVRAVFRTAPSQAERFRDYLSQNIINAYPVVFLVVGLSVLFLRLGTPTRGCWHWSSPALLPFHPGLMDLRGRGLRCGHSQWPAGRS